MSKRITLNSDRVVLCAVVAIAVLLLQVMILGSCEKKGPEMQTVPDNIAPAKVTDLRASSYARTYVYIVWTAPGDDSTSGTAARYDLRYSLSPISISNWNEATVVRNLNRPKLAGTKEVALVPDLEFHTTYYFALQTCDEASNCSPISESCIGRTRPAVDTIAPAAIDDLSISEILETSIAISWTATGDDGDIGTADLYDIRMSTTEIDEAEWESLTRLDDPPVPRVVGSREEMTVSALIADSTYYFAIRVADAAENWSAMSNVATATTEDRTPPAVIRDLHYTDVTESSIELAWTAPGDDDSIGTATSYEIRRSTDVIDDTNWSSALLVSDPPTPQLAGYTESFTITDLDSSTVYTFAIKTEDDRGNQSGISNICLVATRPLFDTIPPAKIWDIYTYQETQTSLMLGWEAPGDDGDVGTAFAYDIRYSLQAIDESNWMNAIIVPNPPDPDTAGARQSLLFEGLVPDEFYSFAIKSVDDVGNISPLSRVISGHTLPPDDRPAAVGDLRVAHASSDFVTLTWTGPPSGGLDDTRIYYYDIRYSTSVINDLNWNSAARRPGTYYFHNTGTIEYADVENLSANRTYYFAIRCVARDSSRSALSDVVPTRTAVADVYPPATIKDLAIINVTPSAFNLSWTVPGDDSIFGRASEYDIRFSTVPLSDGNWYSATETTSDVFVARPRTSEEENIGGMSSNTFYYVGIRTIDDAGNVSPISNVVSGETENNRPGKPRNPIPEHGATDVDTSVTLYWTEINPDTDETVTFDIYFDDVPPPGKLIAMDHPDTFIVVTGLNPNSNYYWKVTPRDSRGLEGFTGGVWRFTTIGGDDPWSEPAPLQTLRYYHGAAAYAGKMYVFGGKSWGGTPLASVEEYDPVSGIWTNKSDMPAPESYVRAETIGDRVFVLSPNATYEYDPVSDTWSVRSSMPWHVYEFGMAAHDDKIFVTGGSDGWYWDADYYAFVQVYDPSTDTWTTRNNLPPWHGWAGTILVSIDGMLYWAGGYHTYEMGMENWITEANNSIYRYDDENDSWQKMSSVPAGIDFASMEPTYAVVDGVLHLMGGAVADWYWVYCSNVNNRIDPSSWTWQSQASMPQARKGARAVAIDGKIYVTGGYCSTTGYQTMIVYDPSLDK